MAFLFTRIKPGDVKDASDPSTGIEAGFNLDKVTFVADYKGQAVFNFDGSPSLYTFAKWQDVVEAILTLDEQDDGDETPPVKVDVKL